MSGRRWRGNTSHTAPPAVEVITSLEDESRVDDGLGSGLPVQPFAMVVAEARLERADLQRLVADVGMGRAGIVLGLEVSRLARNSTDRHRLLEARAIGRRG